MSAACLLNNFLTLYFHIYIDARLRNWYLYRISRKQFFKSSAWNASNQPDIKLYAYGEKT